MAFYGRLNCSNTDVQYAYMQPISNDRGRVRLCLAAHCSQDAFNFLIFSLALPTTSGLLARVYSDLVVIYFVQILHVTCSTLRLVMYSWNVEMALQNFVLFCVYPRYSPWDLENWANRVALHDAALVKRSNGGVHWCAKFPCSQIQNRCSKTAWKPFVLPIIL